MSMHFNNIFFSLKNFVLLNAGLPEEATTSHANNYVDYK